EPIHLQLSSKAPNLQPDIFLPERIGVGRRVSEVEADQLVECPVQMDVLRVRRLLGGQCQASEMPFQFGKLCQVRQRRSSGILAEGSREPVAVLRNARSRRGMLANEGCRGVSYELGTDQPHRRGETFDERP